MAKLKHSDDLPQDKDTWESRIAHRKEVLDEARTDGDSTYVARATERLDRALDNYNRDTK